MKARLGAVLFGIGVLSVVIAVGLAFFVAPAVTKLPYDLKMCKTPQAEDCLKPSVAEAKNAKFLQTKGGTTPFIGIQTGDLVSTTEIDPRADLTHALPAKLDGNVVWDAYGTVVWSKTGEMILQYSAELALDRVTAAAAAYDKQFLQADGSEGPSAVEFTGQLYKFPFHTEKKTYRYFDRDLRRGLPMQFQGTENIKGLEAYRFQQVIADQELVFSPEKIGGLIGKFAPGATSGKVVYGNTRTLWVEPVTGTFLKAQEQPSKVLVPNVGAPTTLLEATFTYNDATIANSVKTAGDTRDQVLLISRNVPIGLSVLGALLLILGLVLVYSRGKRARVASGPVEREKLDAPEEMSAARSGD